jgi:hypothetical protein
MDWELGLENRSRGSNTFVYETCLIGVASVRIARAKGDGLTSSSGRVDWSGIAQSCKAGCNDDGNSVDCELHVCKSDDCVRQELG